MTEQSYQPHELRAIEEKAELDAKLLNLREFTTTEKFASLDMAEQRLLQGQAVAMDGYSSILRRRIERFTPARTASTHGLASGFLSTLPKGINVDSIGQESSVRALSSTAGGDDTIDFDSNDL